MLVLLSIANQIKLAITHPNTNHESLLLYCGGEGGTGKSRVISAIRDFFITIMRENEIVVSATTGVAADNIGGSTIHSLLALRSSRTRISTTERENFWMRKSCLIIDEISMLCLRDLERINQHLKILRKEDNIPFGGINIVILLGDLFQFGPIQGYPLYQTEISSEDVENAAGRYLWTLFRTVFILEEQMGQSGDLEYYQLVQRARKGQLSHADHIELLSHLIYNENSIPLSTTIIVRRHHDRYRLNKIQFDRMLQHTQYSNSSSHSIPAPIAGHIFIGTSRTSLSDQKSVSNFFQANDKNQTKGPAFLPFIPQMPVIINENLFTHLGVVNGKQCLALGFLPNPEGMNLIFISLSINFLFAN